MRQTTLTQSEVLGCVIGWSDLSRKLTMVNTVFWIRRLLIYPLTFSIWMCNIDSVVSFGVDPDSQAF